MIRWNWQGGGQRRPGDPSRGAAAARQPLGSIEAVEDAAAAIRGPAGDLLLFVCLFFCFFFCIRSRVVGPHGTKDTPK